MNHAFAIGMNELAKRSHQKYVLVLLILWRLEGIFLAVHTDS